jgi:hypothetical protein
VHDAAPATENHEQTIGCVNRELTSRAEGHEMNAVAMGMKNSPTNEYTSLRNVKEDLG